MYSGSNYGSKPKRSGGYSGGYNRSRSSGSSSNQSVSSSSTPNTVTGNRSFGSRSSGGYPRSGGRSYGSSRGGFRGGRRNYGHSAPIDPNKFINKAIEVTEESKYVPVNTFGNLGLSASLLKNVELKKYTELTAVQDQSIPSIMQGKDLIGIADTGSGKTAAFLLPLIEKILKNRDERILIVVPTRELADQINAEFRQLSSGMGIYSVLCIGGTNINRQMYDLRRGYNILVGTPGRIKDLIEQRYIEMHRFHTLVLDEVDRMLDMGFIPDVRYLVGLLPAGRQTLFFSATINREVEILMQKFVLDPVRVFLKKRDTAEGIEQDIVMFRENGEKITLLHNILIEGEPKKVLIFSQTKRGVDMLTRELQSRGFRVDSIHGDKTQYLRQKVLKNFKSNLIDILIATDVAARGLDIPDVTHVINYDTPENHEDYIHRIGRTGRANKKGFALTFVRGGSVNR